MSVPPHVPPDVDLDRVWVGVATEVWRRAPGRVERLAARALRSPGLARALTTTPSLLAGWLLATVAVLGAGAVATLSTGVPMVPLLAPALAGAGIAYAYGPGVDPAFELARSMPVSDRMVLLVRASAVFAANAVLGVAASALSTLAPAGTAPLGSAGGVGMSGLATAVTVGWLVPMTAVCAVALAVATIARSAPVGVAAGIAGWTITVLGSDSPTAAVTDRAYYLPYLAVALIGAAATLTATRALKGSA